MPHVLSVMRLHAFIGIILLALLAGTGPTHAQNTAGPSVAPKGELRIAIIADPGLVTRGPDGKLGGVLVELADSLAAKLGVLGHLVLYENRTRYNLSLGKDEWDVALVPRDLSRTEQLAFSDVLVEVDSGYVARPDSRLRTSQDVDRAGIKVAVAQASAADGFLTRTLKHAEIVRLFGGNAVESAREALSSGRADVYAGSTHLAYRIATEVPGATVLVGRFSTVQMTIAVPKNNAGTALPLVNEFVQDAKRKGTITEAIKHAGLGGVRQAK